MPLSYSMPVLLLNYKHQFQYCNKILHLKFYSCPLTSFLPLSPTYYVIPLSSLDWHCSDIKLEASPPFTFPFFPSFSESLAVTCATEQPSQSNKVLHTVPKQPEQIFRHPCQIPLFPTLTHTHTPSRPQPWFYPVHLLENRIFLSVHALSVTENNPAFTTFPARGVFRSSFYLVVLSVWTARLLFGKRHQTFYTQGRPVWGCLVVPQTWANSSFIKYHLSPSPCHALVLSILRSSSSTKR